MIKLAIFDLDGTLLNNETKLDKNFYDNVKLLKDNGITVAISTARPIKSIFHIFDKGVENLLISGEDGNVFFKEDKLIEARFVPLNVINTVNETLKHHDEIATLYTSIDDLFVSEIDHDRFIKWGLSDFVYEKPNPLPSDAKICKIHCYCKGGRKKAIKMINNELSQLASELDILESGFGWIGITEKGSNKAASVKFFMDYLNIKNSDEVAVFGDSGNDVPMFKMTKNSYAMKNAIDDIKKQANFVTEFENHENGAMREVLKFINHQ